MQIADYLLVILISYLIGSLPFAIIVSKIFSLPDPRSFGSGNPGATNVLRSGNKTAAIITLIADILKGVIAVVLIKYLFTSLPAQSALASLFAVVGHIYPLWLKFRGGKGVATAIGVLVGFMPIMALYVLIVFVILIASTRIVSLSSIAGALVVIVLMFAGTSLGLINYQHLILEKIFISTMALLIIYRHHANIRRLIQGQEPKLGKKK